jgi:Tfp pilus assembly protein PilF
MNRTALTLICALAGTGALGCEEPPKVPPQPQPDGGFVPPPQPGGGAIQYGVSDDLPEGAPQMNAQAAALYQQGMQAWATGDLAQAKTFFGQATQADPQAFQAFYSLGAIQERLGEAGALKSYEKAYQIVPAYERAIVAYGVLLARQGKTSEADAFLVKARAKKPKSAALAAALAEVKSLANDTASAQDIAREALKIDPGYAPAMMTIARDHYRNRRLDLALYALKAILEGFSVESPARDPDNAEAHLLKATILAEQDNRVAAMESFRRALELRPDLTAARLKLATYLLESGSAEEALPMLQTALKYDADNLAAHLSLGDAYRLTGQYPLAKQEFEWVKQRDASLPQVHYNLGLLYLFAPEIPGMTKKQQVVAAIASFEKFKERRAKGDRSDVDELIDRAKLKKAEIEALEQAKNPQPVPVPVPEGADGDGT